MAEVREHVFDGIEEYDNPLPRWWLYLFYFTIGIALVYVVIYPSTWFWKGTLGWSAAGQYDAQMAEAEQKWPKPADGGASADLAAALADPAAIQAGQAIFGARCAVCHGKDAEGKIGPSLIDDEWKYGSDGPAVLETIEKGRPGGMPPWGKILSATEMQQVTVYVLSLSKGSQAAAPAEAAGQ